MKINEAVKHFGNKASLARALDITAQAITYWQKSGRIPHLMQFKIQVISKGKLKVSKETKR